MLDLDTAAGDTPVSNLWAAIKWRWANLGEMDRFLAILVGASLLAVIVILAVN